MRILLQVDMEGAAGIGSVEECFPCWEAYWERGRPALTRDVAAVAEGLLAGGASEIVIDDQHASGVPNVIAADLPGQSLLGVPDVVWREQQQGTFYAVFQVGRHARRGTPGGFLAHTMLPGMEIAIDDVPVTESHIFGWRLGRPLLGITGDDTLAGQIDGALAGVPYLVVKHSLGRNAARPVHADAAAGADALRIFARNSLILRRSRVTPTLPASFTLTITVPEEQAAIIAGQAGLRQTGPGSLSIDAADWWTDAEPALQAAMAATYTTFPPISDDPATLDVLRAFISTWAGQEETA